MKISGTPKTYLSEIKVTKPKKFIFFSFFFIYKINGLIGERNVAYWVQVAECAGIKYIIALSMKGHQLGPVRGPLFDF